MTRSDGRFAIQKYYYNLFEEKLKTTPVATEIVNNFIHESELVVCYPPGLQATATGWPGGHGLPSWAKIRVFLLK